MGKRFTLSHLLVGACLVLTTHCNAQFYTVTQSSGISWFTQAQLGDLWSFGVDCTDLGDKGKPGNPAYNAASLFANTKTWVQDTLAKYKTWGINSLGAWSDYNAFNKFSPVGQRLPYFVVLHLGSYDKAPWDDQFAPAAEKLAKAAADQQILPLRDDPYLVGYFTDNELGWWDDTLFTTYFAMPKSSLGKQRLVRVLRQFYHENLDRLKLDWSTHAKSFSDLLDERRMYLKPGGTGIKAVHDWNRVLADRYYSLMYKIVKADDPNHLILGDRYAQYYNIETAAASRKYIDVASTNYGADWLDGSYSKFFLDTLHHLTGKPIVITEFYFAARENQTGNRNSGQYFPTVQSQVERAKGFAACVRYFASVPYVMGAHWFQFYDEPSKGRGDGEDYNHGLVDIHGVPYEEMVSAASKLHPDKIHEISAEKADAYTMRQPVPKAPEAPMSGLMSWNRELGFVSPSTAVNWADLYLATDDRFLYAGLYDMEYMDESLYSSGTIPEADRPLLSLHIGHWKGTVRFNGKGRKALCSDSRVVISEKSGLKYSVMLKVPLVQIGAVSPSRVSGELLSHGRGYRMAWGK